MFRFALLASVLGLVAPQVAKAYTLRFNADGQPVRWAAPRVPMRLDAELVSDRDESTLATERAFATWAGIPGVPTLVLDGAARLRPGFDPRGENENGIYTVVTLPIPGVALAVTVTTYREDDGRILDADILVAASRELAFLDDEPRGRDRRSYDLASLLAHESGHVLGLGETPDDDAATMSPRLRRGDTAPRTLEEDDEAGVLELYANTGVMTRASCGVQGPLGHRRSGVPALVGIILIALTGLLRRRERRFLVAGAAALAFATALAASRPAASADDGFRGRAHLLEVRWQDGLLVSDFEVATPSGQVLLEIPGGVRDGIVQQVGEALPPADGAELWVSVVGADGLRDWRNLSEPSASNVLRSMSDRPPASVR